MYGMPQNNLKSKFLVHGKQTFLLISKDVGPGRGKRSISPSCPFPWGEEGTGIFVDAMTHKKHWDLERNCYGLTNYYG